MKQVIITTLYVFDFDVQLLSITQITKNQFNDLVEKNFTSGMVMMLIDQLEFLRGAYKMKEKQILNNTYILHS